MKGRSGKLVSHVWFSDTIVLAKFPDTTSFGLVNATVHTLSYYFSFQLYQLRLG